MLSSTPIPGEHVLPLFIPSGHHALVNVVFQGPLKKLVRVTRLDGEVFEALRNCGGHVVSTIVIPGSLSDQFYDIIISCSQAGCNAVGNNPGLLDIHRYSGPIGASNMGVSAMTYIYLPGGATPETSTESIGITIVVQVGIDPSSRV